jgi:DNA repair photolyase
MIIETWVFITPVLPGITDVKTMVDALPENTPVYVDKLGLDLGSAFEELRPGGGALASQ